MWTSAAAKAAPEMDEAGVVIGDFRLASLVHEPADESERFQEEIRTLMMASDNTGPLELSGGTTCCYFTALLGLVSKSNEGTTTTGGEGVPVPTTPACVLPQLLSSSPTTEIFPPDTAPYSMFLAAPETGEKHLGVGGSPCATDSPEKVNTTGSDCGPEPPLELEAATGGQRKRCAKRKSKVKPPSSGKRKSKAAVLAAAREKETDSKEEEAAADNDLKCDAGDCGAVEEKVEKEKLPFVHVRARRGQATDRHSLAERARREKINARMKLLQDLVPGCNKISGTALVLEEIINHVQTLQRQVEILSMRLAAVNPRFDLSELDGFLDAADALAMLEVPPEAWDGCSEVPATTTLARQEDGCLWQHLQQHQVESADALIGPHHHHQQQQQVMMQVSSPSAWGREGTDHVRLFTTHEYQNHHLLRHGHGLGYESSNPGNAYDSPFPTAVVVLLRKWTLASTKGFSGRHLRTWSLCAGLLGLCRLTSIGWLYQLPAVKRQYLPSFSHACNKVIRLNASTCPLHHAMLHSSTAGLATLRPCYSLLIYKTCTEDGWDSAPNRCCSICRPCTFLRSP